MTREKYLVYHVICPGSKTELGRERMALELQEEKKAQAKCEQWLE
jgi:hypothetical protein